MLVEPGVERLSPVFLRPIPRERDQAYPPARRGRPDAAGHFVAVDAGKSDVDESDVERLFHYRTDRGRPVAGLMHDMTLELEQYPHERPQVGAVIDEQDAARRR